MKKKKPADSELEILNILWKKGPMSVRNVHDILSEKKDVFYTTTLKTMQVMTDKGFLKRDTSQRSHIYEAAVRKDEIQKKMINRLAETMFGGSAGKLIISAIGHSRPSPEELEEIKSIINKLSQDEHQ